MSKDLITYTIFRLEKAIPTHCPNCAHPFGVNGDGGFAYDTRLRHPKETAAEWTAVFPAAGVFEGLEVEPVWCRACHNITLRIITAVRHVATTEEADELERLGYGNRRAMECTGIFFSRQPDYTLKIESDPALKLTTFTLFPLRGWRGPPRS